MLKFAIIGAGAGGQSMAAILTSKGYIAKLYDIDKEKIHRLQELKTIKVTGVIACEAAPAVITDRIDEVMDDVDVIMVVSTTDAHRSIAYACKPYLKDGQIVMLNPGHCGGALEIANILRGEDGCGKDLIIAEAGDLMYGCRSYEVGNILHTGLKVHVPVATLPASDIDRLMKVLGPIFPCLQPAANVLETGFEGAGAMLHPIPSLMNINWGRATTITWRESPHILPISSPLATRSVSLYAGRWAWMRWRWGICWSRPTSWSRRTACMI